MGTLHQCVHGNLRTTVFEGRQNCSLPIFINQRRRRTLTISEQPDHPCCNTTTSTTLSPTDMPTITGTMTPSMAPTIVALNATSMDVDDISFVGDTSSSDE